jgi:hypothetical protein
MPGHHPPPEPRDGPVQNDGKAVASLVFGLLSLTCAGLFTGIPAMILGTLAQRDIQASRGKRIGGGMATAGSVLGAFGTFLNVIFFAFAGYVAAAAYAAHGGAPPVAQAASRTTQPAHAEESASDDSYGTIEVVRAGAGDPRPLRLQLYDAQKRAEVSKKTLLVVARAHWAAPSRKFEASLPDPRMQVALSSALVVLVDVDEYGPELATFGCQIDSVPFFFKLDSRQRAVDAIGSAEWDEETPGDMAPVLTEFLAGTYAKRREPPAVGTVL